MSVSAIQPRLDRRDLGIALALAVAILGLYAQTLGFDFVGWDDPQYVTANEQVRAGLEPAGIAWAFRTDTMGSWHPLTWLSHMLDVELFGLDPAGHHAINAILHALASVLLFVALRVLTQARWQSALVAALFGIHPLHVESVAWIAERKDVLSTCLGLAAIWAYASWARRGGALRYLALVLLFAGSLMSKPMLVTLPLILLLLDYWPLRRTLQLRLLLEKLPLLALSAVCSFSALRTQELTTAIPFAQRVANAALAATGYLRRTFWPADLAMFYPHPYLPESGALPPPAWQVAAAVALLLAISVSAIALARRRYLAVGWLWYGISLTPVIGIVQVGAQGMADRYTYFPLIGIFIAGVWGGADLVTSLARRFPAIAKLAPAVVLVWLAALSLVTWRQIGTWRDSLTLYQHALEVVPSNPKIRFNLANLLRRQGRNAEAIAQYRLALETAPSDAAIHVNLANALRTEGDLAAAMQHYLAALERKPDDAMAHLNLGALLREQGELEQAEAHYRKSMRLAPSAKTAYNIANLRRERGNLDGAIDAYRLVLRLQPRNAKAHNNLGLALEQRGELEVALRHFSAAAEIDPQHARAWRSRGRALLQLGRPVEALEALRRALALEPDDAAARALWVQAEAQARDPLSEKPGSPAP
jgi:tetratricopeptide (TPR) repeat protein